LTFTEPSQQKFLRHSALEHCVHQKHIATLYVGPLTESHLAPCVTSLLHVANILLNEMADRWHVDVAYQVRPKYKAAIQRNHYVQSLAIARL
jgi:hypothetical protein